RKLWRKAWRHRTATLSGLAVVLSLALALFVTGKVRDSQRRLDLQSRVQEGLNTEKWSPAHADALEAVLAELADDAPDQANRYRAALKEQYHKAVAKVLAQARLEPGDLAYVHEGIADLERRFPGAAADLQEQLRQRHGEWVSAFRLAGPFTGWDK